MVKKIFIKNFRGFGEEIISLKQVNFFVGENSTGKTSILKLINLLSKREFWFSSEFNTNEVDLGYFSEIVNKCCKEKIFQVGIEKSVGKGSDTLRIIAEFKKDSNVPRVHRLKLATKENELVMHFDFKSNEFRYEERKRAKAVFENWVKDISFKDSDKIKKGKGFNEGRSLLNVVFDISFGKDKKENYVGYFINSKESFILYESYTWLAPIRAKAKRMYDSYRNKFSPEGNHVFPILKKIYTEGGFRNERIVKRLECFGKESNLFDKIKVANVGRTDESPFEINAMYKGMAIKLPHVGHGVAQSLPLIVEILQSKSRCCSIQQPEVHLHPKAQVAFGKLLLDSAREDKNEFLIETHSDFTINRFRYEMSKSENKKQIDAKILFFERAGKENKISSISIGKDCSLSGEALGRYREFFIDEELRLLEM